MVLAQLVLAARTGGHDGPHVRDPVVHIRHQRPPPTHRRQGSLRQQSSLQSTPPFLFLFSSQLSHVISLEILSYSSHFVQLKNKENINF